MGNYSWYFIVTITIVHTYYMLVVGGWATPLKNMSSSVGMMKFPIDGTTKNCPNHQPATHQLWDSLRNVLDRSFFSDLLAGWWLGHPSEKYERQLGWWHSQYMGKYQKWQPNHQPVRKMIPPHLNRSWRSRASVVALVPGSQRVPPIGPRGSPPCEEPSPTASPMQEPQASGVNPWQVGGFGLPVAQKNVEDPEKNHHPGRWIWLFFWGQSWLWFWTHCDSLSVYKALVFGGFISKMLQVVHLNEHTCYTWWHIGPRTCFFSAFDAREKHQQIYV